VGTRHRRAAHRCLEHPADRQRPHDEVRPWRCHRGHQLDGSLKALTDGSGGADAYAAAKIGVTGLVRAYAQRMAAKNIRVMVIAPTGVNTSMIVENPALLE